MKYLNKKFTIGLSNKKFRKGWDRIFNRKKTEGYMISGWQYEDSYQQEHLLDNTHSYLGRGVH